MDLSALVVHVVAVVITAQEMTSTSLSGGAGWVGAGLLGCVLAWLMFKHLPDKDKLVKDLLASHDNAIAAKDAAIAVKDADIKSMIETFSKSLHVAQASFEARNNKALEVVAAVGREERAIYQTWHEENRGRIDQLLLEMRELRHFQKNLSHQLGLQKAVEEASKKPRTTDLA